MTILGRKVAAKNLVRNVGSGAGVPELLATIFGPVPANSWVTAFGGWVGTRGAAGQALKIGAFSVDADGEPDQWLGEVPFTADVTLTGAGAGERVEARQTVSNTGLANQGIPLLADAFVAVYVFSLAAAAVSYGASPKAALLSKDGLAAVPLQFGDYEVTVDQALDLYLVTAPNNAKPIVDYSFLRDDRSNGNHFVTPYRNPSDHVALWGGEVAVNFTTFDLVDQTHGDEIASVHLQVATKPDVGSMVWERTLSKGDLYAILQPSGLDPTYDLIASYSGPKLAPGVYFARARFGDHFGAFSDWTPWLQEGGGNALAVWVDRQNFYLDVPLGLTPRGRISTANPASFTALYSAACNVPATEAHLLVSQVVAGVVTKVVLSEVVAIPGTDPGETITIAWDGGWADLDPGTDYAFRIRAISLTGGRYYVSNAPDWQHFRTNAQPTTPIGLEPDSPNGIDDLPLLAAVASDADDTPLTGFGVRFRITRPDLSQVTVNAQLAAGTSDLWQYQTTATEVPAFGDYTWEAQSFDSDYTSPWSAAASFNYTTLPVVSISSVTPGP